MNSFISRVKRLSVFTEYLFYSKAGVVLYCTRFPRFLLTKNVLLSNSLHGKISKDPHNYAAASNIQKNLGTVVDLDVDFEDVRIDDEIKVGRKKKAKKVKKDVEAHCQEHNSDKKNCAADAHKRKIVDADSAFSSVMSRLKSNKRKEKDEKIILEGKRLIHDAISAGYIPEKIFFSRKTDLEKVNVPDSVKLFKVSYKSFKLWTDTVTPQGITGVFKMPDLSQPKKSGNSVPLTIICDNVREPGNLGAMLRVAASVGCEKLILCKGCVSIWESKVLRAAAGAHFHISVREKVFWSDIESEVSENSKVFLADLNCQTVNESADSKSKERTSIFSVTSSHSESLPLQCYSSVNYTDADTVIVIGGETLGLSDEAYKFAAKRQGVRIFIPMNDVIESLNNSVALGIIAYEFKRQINPVFQDSRLSLTGTENTDSGNGRR